MTKKIILAGFLTLCFSSAQAMLMTPTQPYSITASLDIYDTNGQLIHNSTANGNSLLSNGSVTFSDPSLISPFVVHDFSVISSIGPETLVGMQLDWGLSNDVYNEETWVLVIADDFMTGSSSYFYTSIDVDGDGIAGTQLSNVAYVGGANGYPPASQYLESGMTVNLELEMRSGPIVVPVPSSFWLLLSGLLGGFGALRMHHQTRSRFHVARSPLRST